MWEFVIFAQYGQILGAHISGFLTVWIASGEKKFRLFLFLFGKGKFLLLHNLSN